VPPFYPLTYSYRSRFRFVELELSRWRHSPDCSWNHAFTAIAESPQKDRGSGSAKRYPPAFDTLNAPLKRFSLGTPYAWSTFWPPDCQLPPSAPKFVVAKSSYSLSFYGVASLTPRGTHVPSLLTLLLLVVFSLLSSYTFPPGVKVCPPIDPQTPIEARLRVPFRSFRSLLVIQFPSFQSAAACLAPP